METFIRSQTDACGWCGVWFSEEIENRRYHRPLVFVVFTLWWDGPQVYIIFGLWWNSESTAAWAVPAAQRRRTTRRGRDDADEFVSAVRHA
jgi:hypothetical protein